MRHVADLSPTASAATRWRSASILAALAGAGISIYLLVEYLAGSGGICLTGSGCDLVRQSAFASPLGVPLPLFGVGFYMVAAWLVWRTLRPRPLLGVAPTLALAAWASLGLLASMVLTGLEAFVIHAFCTWCVGQAIASLALTVTAFAPVVGAGRTAGPSEGRKESGRERKLRLRAAEAERSRLRSLTLAGGGVVSIAVASLLVVGAVSAGQPIGAPSASTSELAPADAPRLGSGPVTVVEFADFQCPACAAVSPILDDLAGNGAITLVYRHFPLPQHANAVPAARAAEAAAEKGKFWPMHDLLFETQQQWEALGGAQAEAFFRGLAGRIGLHQAAWQTAYDAAAGDSRVQTDAAAAHRLALPGTPSIFINGRRYAGSLSASALGESVSAAAGS